LRSRAPREKGEADHCGTCETHYFFHNLDSSA
jgi:hypothetical protein